MTGDLTPVKGDMIDGCISKNDLGNLEIMQGCFIENF